MAPAPDIELSAQERELLGRILFEAHTQDQWEKTLAPMTELAELLLERRAVPDVRLKYFTDPEFNPGGRGKSRKDVFERNGTRGDEILRHPHFLKFLEYFIFGPQLPPEIIARFRETAASFGHLSGSDLLDLAPEARAFVRSRRMNTHTASEEFFKLAIECGAMPSSADGLRKSIRAVRTHGD